MVPKPDEQRGNIVKPVIILTDEFEPNGQLQEDIRSHVREQLAAHEYPREIEFVEDLPRTVTGKIRRTELRDQVIDPTTQEAE